MAVDDHLRVFTRQTEMQLMVWAKVIRERARQEELKAAGKFLYTCADPQMLSADKYVVLGEEFGELGRAILNMQGLATDYKGGLEDVQKELIQVAAVSLAWLEFIEGLLYPLPGMETPAVTPTDEGKTPPDLSASLE